MIERGGQGGLSFGLAWLAAVAAGVLVGGMLAFGSMWTAGEAVLLAFGADTTGPSLAGAPPAALAAGGLVAGGLFGAFFALGASLGPGLLLQGKGLDALRWMLYSAAAGAAGAGVGFAILFAASGSLSSLGSGAAMGLCLGLPIGAGQALLLRRQGLSTGGEASGWLLVSTAGYLAAALAITQLSGEGRELLALGSAGLLLGAVTALGMLWLLGRQAAAAA